MLQVHMKRCQLPDLRPYKEPEKRTQQIMRAKTIYLLEDSANKCVHFKSEDITHFVSDLVSNFISTRVDEAD